MGGCQQETLPWLAGPGLRLALRPAARCPRSRAGKNPITAGGRYCHLFKAALRYTSESRDGHGRAAPADRGPECPAAAPVIDPRPTRQPCPGRRSRLHPSRWHEQRARFVRHHVSPGPARPPGAAVGRAGAGSGEGWRRRQAGRSRMRSRRVAGAMGLVRNRSIPAPPPQTGEQATRPGPAPPHQRPSHRRPHGPRTQMCRPASRWRDEVAIGRASTRIVTRIATRIVTRTQKRGQKPAGPRRAARPASCATRMRLFSRPPHPPPPPGPRRLPASRPRVSRPSAGPGPTRHAPVRRTGCTRLGAQVTRKVARTSARSAP